MHRATVFLVVTAVAAAAEHSSSSFGALALLTAISSVQRALLVAAPVVLSAKDHRGSLCGRCKDGSAVDGGTKVSSVGAAPRRG